MNVTQNDQLAPLLRDVQTAFGITIVSFDPYRPKFLRPDVTVHMLTDADNKYLGDNRFFAIHDWFEERGWLVSRQTFKKPPRPGLEHTYIAPAQRIQLRSGFHATRAVAIASIFQHGLLPGDRLRCTTDRIDALGNIYVAEKLGQPGDESRCAYGTAHWWREHLARENRFGDPQWTILEIDFVGQDVCCYHDIWSHTGVVVRVRNPVDPRQLKVVA
jgi:hypothetical protein